MLLNEPMLKAVGTGVALIALCSTPALGTAVTRLSKRHVRCQDVYEDADGKATPESVKAYSAKLAKSLVLISAAAGLAISIALLVLSLRAEGRLLLTDSLSTAAWVSRGLPTLRVCPSAQHADPGAGCSAVPGCDHSFEQELSPGLRPRPLLVSVRDSPCQHPARPGHQGCRAAAGV